MRKLKHDGLRVRRSSATCTETLVQNASSVFPFSTLVDLAVFYWQQIDWHLKDPKRSGVMSICYAELNCSSRYVPIIAWLQCELIPCRHALGCILSLLAHMKGFRMSFDVRIHVSILPVTFAPLASLSSRDTRRRNGRFHRTINADSFPVYGRMKAGLSMASAQPFSNFV